MVQVAGARAALPTATSISTASSPPTSASNNTHTPAIPALASPIVSPTTSTTTHTPVARVAFPILPSISITQPDTESSNEDALIPSRSGSPEPSFRSYTTRRPSQPYTPARPLSTDMPLPRTSMDTIASLGDDMYEGQDGEANRRPSMEEILPFGMDMRGALAQCEDPILGWSLQFWITIVDPVTGHAFFACPATGQTSWTPPTGVFIVPRQAEGEWWELADTTRGNRSYFYNTLTKVTQWTRPGGDAFVIPLGLIQSATLPKRVIQGSRSDRAAAVGLASSAKAAKGKGSDKVGSSVSRQDSIQLHHKGLNKKRSKQQLRSATSNETIKPSSTSRQAQADAQAASLGKKGGRSRASTVTAPSAPSVRFPTLGREKPLPVPPMADGSGSDLPPHPGFPSTPSGAASGASSPASPFGPRIPLPPDSPSTPSKIAMASHGWGSGGTTPTTPTPRTSRLKRAVDITTELHLDNADPWVTDTKIIESIAKQIHQASSQRPGSMSPQTPQTPNSDVGAESDSTATPARRDLRKLRPLSVVGEELSGNEADDSSVSDIEPGHTLGKGKIGGGMYGLQGSVDKGKEGEKDKSKRESLFSRRRLSSLGFGILGKSPEFMLFFVLMTMLASCAPPVPRRGSSLSITSISAPSPLNCSNIDLRSIGMAVLSSSPSTRTLDGSGKNDKEHLYSPILASAKIHIQPSSRPIPILPLHSSVDLSSASALGFTPATGTGVAGEFKNLSGKMRTKRFSTGPHPLLPSPISSEIHAFQLDSFADTYFAKRRTGIMRTRVPLTRLLTWQKSPITGPLLEATGKNYGKEAVIAFKVIQRAMCERDKPVEGAKPLRAASVAELETMPSNKTMGLGAQVPPHGAPGTEVAGGSPVPSTDANVQILEEVRWMIQISVFAPEMRDEVYAQVVKQLTGNQTLSAMVLGFQLLCVLVNAFSPSAKFEPFVSDFLARHIEQNIKGIGIMALYCQNKLVSNRKHSARARPLTIGEIEHASDAAFYPSIYGDSLDAIMQRQATTFSGPPRNPSHNLGGTGTEVALNVPVILPFLAKAILHLGGSQAEGIFRVPGDAEVVAELKSRMNRGHYQLAGMSDPHVAASLFKLFLRELAEPVVPSHMYNEALESSSTPEEAIAFLRTLPQTHRQVLVFVIYFTRRFCAEEVVRATKMTPSNLALVLAPNILRTTSDSLVTVYTNAAFESKWILTLLQSLQKEYLDKSDWPEEDF